LKLQLAIYTLDDPRGFLDNFPGGRAIIDEAQRFPQLPSWLQGVVDKDPVPGRFFLTGSNQPFLKSQLVQSLAERGPTCTKRPSIRTNCPAFPENPPEWKNGYSRDSTRRYMIGLSIRQNGSPST